MPHSTSDQTTRFVSPSVMTSQESAIPKRDGGITSGGFSLFPGQAGPQPPLSEERSDTMSVDGRDPAQIEAALGILNEPRVDTMTMTNKSSGERGENDGRAMSPDEGRKLTQYFEDQFAYKDGHVGSARERIQKDSPIIAELRTNVIIKDEFTLVTDMSYHLSTRYSRPESSIMINIDHSACLLHAGSFEPAYILTISAIPSQIQPTLNKRNAALIQSFMADVLSVSPERGVLRFASIPEENLASNGATVFGEIERIEKQQAEDHGHNHIKRSFTRGSRRSIPGVNKRHTTQSEAFNMPDINASSASLISPTPVQSPAPQGVYELSAEEKRRSMNALLNKTDKPLTGVLKDRGTPYRPGDATKRRSLGYTTTPKPPPVPMDAPTTKVSKRKSFLAVFRRP